MILACPHCQAGLDVSESLGLTVQCPHCGQNFYVPGLPAVQAPLQTGVLLDRPAPPQVIVVDASRRPLPRMNSGGWFVRSFTSAIGVLMAVVLVLSAVSYSGYWYLKRRVVTALETRSDNIEETNAAAKVRALRILKPKGFVDVSADTREISSRMLLGNSRSLRGMAKRPDGSLHSFDLRFEVATFGQTIEWHLREVIIDGEVVKPGETPRAEE